MNDRRFYPYLALHTAIVALWVGVSRNLCKRAIGAKQGKIFCGAEDRSPVFRLDRIIAGNRRRVKGGCLAAVHSTLDAAAGFR